MAVKQVFNPISGDFDLVSDESSLGLPEVLSNNNTTSDGQTIDALNGGGRLDLRFNADGDVVLSNDNSGFTKGYIYMRSSAGDVFFGHAGNYINMQGSDNISFSVNTDSSPEQILQLNSSEFIFEKESKFNSIARYNAVRTLTLDTEFSHKKYVDDKTSGVALNSPVIQKEFADTGYTANWGEDIEVDASLGPVTINLPTAVGNNGKTINITLVNATNPLTLDGAGAETINGATTRVLNSAYATVTLKSNGTNITLR